MPSQPRSFLSLSRLVSRFPHGEEFFHILTSAARDRNERSAVLTLVSLLEGAFQLSLKKRLERDEKGEHSYLFNPGCPLRDLSSKIKIGFALKMYGPQTRDDLDAIREVRNSFAHSMSLIDFGTQEVANVCNRITIQSRYVIPESGPDSTPKNIFMWSAMGFTIEFYRLAAPNLFSPETGEAIPEFTAFRRAMLS